MENITFDLNIAKVTQDGVAFEVDLTDGYAGIADTKLTHTLSAYDILNINSGNTQKIINAVDIDWNKADWKAVTVTEEPSTGIQSTGDLIKLIKYATTVGGSGGGLTYSVADSSNLGLIKIGFNEPDPNTNKRYAVKLDDGNKAYVEVPWESSGLDNTKLASDLNTADKPTTNTPGYLYWDGSSYSWLSGTSSNYTLPTANTNTLGGIKTGYSQTDKNYPVQLDSNNKAYVYVPWTDTTYSLSDLLPSGATDGLYLKASVSGGTTTYIWDTPSTGGTSYSIFSANTDGLVPMASNANTGTAGSSDKFLRSDGKWVIPSGGTFTAPSIGLGSSSLGNTSLPVYWNGSSFVTANSYPKIYTGDYLNLLNRMSVGSSNYLTNNDTGTIFNLKVDGKIAITLCLDSVKTINSVNKYIWKDSLGYIACISWGTNLILCPQNYKLFMNSSSTTLAPNASYIAKDIANNIDKNVILINLSVITSADTADDIFDNAGRIIVFEGIPYVQHAYSGTLVNVGGGETYGNNDSGTYSTGDYTYKFVKLTPIIGTESMILEVKDFTGS